MTPEEEDAAAGRPLLRPQGFAPRDISSMVQRQVVEQHADEAAFLWGLRERAVRAPHYRLVHLARLDERLLAHLEGLRVAGATGWAFALRGLEQGDAGALFVLAWLAFMSQDPDRMRLALQAGLAEPRLCDALVAALAWIEPGHADEPLRRLALSAAAAHRRLAVAVLAAHRRNSGVLLSQALSDPDAALRARALRSIGETKRFDLRDAAQAALQDADADCRCAAACSLLLLGDADAAPLLLAAAPRPDRLEAAVRGGRPEQGRDLVRSLAATEATRREAIMAAGALGDPAIVPWLVDQMAEPRWARVAGAAFSMLTGADLDLLGFKQDAPPDADDGEPEDDDLVWPCPAAIGAWWQAERPRFVPGQRYLAGQPVSAEAAAGVLRSGYQRQRHAAAFELARLMPQAVPFAVLARADWQRQRLRAC